MWFNTVSVFLGLILDFVFGDPHWVPHPVKIIGWFICKLEIFLRKIFPKTFAWEKFAGVLLTLIIVGGTFTVTLTVLNIFLNLSYILAIIVSSIIIYTGISVKDMKISAMRVYDALLNSDIERAKIETAKIVGRDTKNLSETEIIRATVETIAESITDGIISPIFYACISVPLMMAYKSISTLDSMVGYKNSKYINFGWASAKLDDIANFIPARIAGFLAIPIASFICKKNTVNSFKIALRDGAKNPSPNSGLSEAAIAGALDIQLGGINYYEGIKSEKSLIGEATNKLSIAHIKESIRIMYVASLITLLLVLAVVELL